MHFNPDQIESGQSTALVSAFAWPLISYGHVTIIKKEVVEVTLWWLYFFSSIFTRYLFHFQSIFLSSVILRRQQKFEKTLAFCLGYFFLQYLNFMKVSERSRKNEDESKSNYSSKINGIWPHCGSKLSRLEKVLSHPIVSLLSAISQHVHL